MSRKTEEELKDWEGEIDRAEKYLEGSKRLAHWRQHRDWYSGHYGDDVVSVNLLFAIGRALVPQLYFKVPTILVETKKRGSENNAKILEATNSWLIDHIGMKEQIKLGITDAFLTNIAVFKYGYHSVGSEFPTSAQEKLPEQMQLALTDFLGEGPAQDLIDDDEERMKYSYHDWVKPDSPWMLRVQPEDFLVPFGIKDLASTPWCAFRVCRPLDDVKADPVYENTKDLKPNVSYNKKKENSPNQFKQYDGDTEYLEYFEIWDKRDGRIRVYAPNNKKFMRHEEHGLPIDGLPAEILRFNPVGWDFWGESDAYQIHKQILELNETRTLEMRHRRALILKLLVDKNAITDAQLKQITDGDVSAVKVDGPLTLSVQVLAPSMSRDIFNIDEVIRNDIREVMSFSRNQAGDFSTSRTTAHEVETVRQAIELRSDERRDMVADLISASFQRKINPMIFEFWTEQRTI
ncbi:MAG TPA: hypothetical protein VJ044_01235, partial [Candidatus Hodarchaeales archaeon]|nr:hypothetical protein [Candidatus Hodarchaeales archaeon]